MENGDKIFSDLGGVKHPYSESYDPAIEIVHEMNNLWQELDIEDHEIVGLITFAESKGFRALEDALSWIFKYDPRGTIETSSNHDRGKMFDEYFKHLITGEKNYHLDEHVVLGKAKNVLETLKLELRQLKALREELEIK